MYHKSKVNQYTDNFCAIDFMNLINMGLSFFIAITVLFVGLRANRACLDDFNDEYILKAFSKVSTKMYSQCNCCSLHVSINAPRQDVRSS